MRYPQHLMPAPHVNPNDLQSQKGAELIWRFPILLDACANEVQRQGDAMMSKWAEVSCNCYA